MPRKKICVITGSRAEYGLLKPLIDNILLTKQFQLQLIVTGMHLSHEFGLTYHLIENDHLHIDKKIEILLSSDTPTGITKSMGLTLIGFADAFSELQPDLLIVLGDRFEAFSAVCAAHVAQIPVAHLNGGEITEGAMDDAFRHSISKMSHIHFTSTEEYRKRVIQLGESPDNVFNVGSIGIDVIKNMHLLSKAELAKALRIHFSKRNLLVTFHPATIGKNEIALQFKKVLSALHMQKDTFVIFTKSNADTHGRAINRLIDAYAEENRGACAVFGNLGQLNYLSLMQYVDAVVGNSSSGIIEAPFFKIGTINIGDRQSGRLKAKSIIDCAADVRSIDESFRLLYSETFQKKLKTAPNLYGDGTTSKTIIHILKKYDFSKLITKRFHDIRFSIQ